MTKEGNFFFGKIMFLAPGLNNIESKMENIGDKGRQYVTEKAGMGYLICFPKPDRKSGRL